MSRTSSRSPRLTSKRQDRELYVPRQRRHPNGEMSDNERRPARNIELLGRFGKIDDYEFEFEQPEDAARAAASLRRYGDFADGGASLVHHVESPIELSMRNRKIEEPKKMRADFEEAGIPIGGNHLGLPGKQSIAERHLLDDEEMLLPLSQRNLPWNSINDRTGRKVENRSRQVLHLLKNQPSSIENNDSIKCRRGREDSNRNPYSSLRKPLNNASASNHSSASRNMYLGKEFLTSKHEVEYSDSDDESDPSSTDMVNDQSSSNHDDDENSSSSLSEDDSSQSSYNSSGDDERQEEGRSAEVITHQREDEETEQNQDEDEESSAHEENGESLLDTSRSPDIASVQDPPIEISGLPQSINTNVPETYRVSGHSFEFEMLKRFPDTLSRRLLSAIWIGIYYPTLKTKQAAAERGLSSNDPEPGNEFISCLSMALGYFKKVHDVFLSKAQQIKREQRMIKGERRVLSCSPLACQHISREAAHFLCHVCVIMGDLCRYGDSYRMKALQIERQESLCSPDGDQDKQEEIFSSCQKWYHQAVRFFSQEGHIYTQWSYLFVYNSDLLGRVVMTMRSTLCSFQYNNRDLLTLMLESASQFSADRQNITAVTNVFVLRLMTITQSIYSKIRLEQFESQLELLCQTLKAITLMILLVIETSHQTKNSLIGEFIANSVHSIKLNLTTIEQRPIYFVDDANYEQTHKKIKDEYEKLPWLFCDVLRNGVDYITLTDINERFKCSCILLCSITRIVAEAIRSPLSPLLGIVFYSMQWLISSGLWSSIGSFDNSSCEIKTENSFVSSIKKLREKVAILALTLEREAVTSNLTNDLLKYALPEDDYMEGFVPTPLPFCIYESSKTPLTATMVIPPSATVERSDALSFFCHFVHYCNSSNINEPSPIFFGPLGTSDTSPTYVAHEAVRIYRSQSTGDLVVTKSADKEGIGDRGRRSVVSADNSMLLKVINGRERSQSAARAARHEVLHVESIQLSPSSSPLEHCCHGAVTSRHLHITAKKDCGDIPLSLVRLARLLVVASTLPEFQKAFLVRTSENDLTVKTIIDTTTSTTNQSNEMTPLQVLQEKIKLQRLLGHSVATSGSLAIKGSNSMIYQNYDGYHKGRKLLDLVGSNRVQPAAEGHTGGLLRVKISEHKYLADGKPDGETQKKKRQGQLTGKRYPLSSQKQSHPCEEDIKRSELSSDVGKHILATIKGELEKKSRLIVIDGSNVAHRHGGLLVKKFSSQGIQIAVDYYLNRGYEVLAFVPEYVVKYRTVGETVRAQKAGFKINVSRIPDNVEALHQIAAQGYLSLTPPQDHDDSYIIRYARNHNGCIVSNDLYRDHIEKSNDRKALKKWMRKHLISYTFVGDEFMPNPDFKWPTDDPEEVK